MSLPIKQWLDANLSLVDHNSQEPVPATFSGIKLTSSDSSIFTADSDVNDDSVMDIVGVSVGTGVLTVEALATYTDSVSGTETTQAKTATIDVEVTAPEPGQETDLIVTLSNPQVIPNASA